MTEKYIEYAKISAYELLEKLKINNNPISPDDIAKQLGIEVRENVDITSISNEEEGKAFVENGKAVIWINPFLSDNRKKFTLAHEIAHVINDIAPNLRDKKDVKPFEDDGLSLSFARSGDASIIEYAANEYAARLLMPKDLIVKIGKEIIDRHQKDNADNPIYKDEFVKELAEKFSVSKSAMSIRLIRLDILS